MQREGRTELRSHTGEAEIPVLVAHGEIVRGEQAILAYLNEHYIEAPDAGEQRAKATNAKQKELEAACPKLAAATRRAPAPSTRSRRPSPRVREELTAAGFGVLCEIDVQATLRHKLGVEREPYLILGACNPPLAHAALEAEPELGVLLPCNVVVYEKAGQTHIAAVDAEQMLSIVDKRRAREHRQRGAPAPVHRG